MSDNYSSLPLVIESLEDNNVITLNIILGTIQATLFYSTDDVTYDSMTLSYTTDIITLNVGEKLYIDSFIVEGYRNLLDCGIKFLTTGKFIVYGNLDNVSTSYHVRDGIYSNVMPFLFSKSKVVEADNLSMAHSFGDYAYYMMFNECKYLETAPTLPATTLTDFCYARMFSYCDKLSTVPSLPATTLAPYCYMAMFRGCNTVTAVPELPATELTEGCYLGMFADCDKLYIARNINAKFLEDYAYDYMFYNCDDLSSIHARMLYEPNKKNTYNWTIGVHDNGYFTKYSHATWERFGTHYIPYNWEILYDGNTDYARMPLTIEADGMDTTIGVQFQPGTSYVKIVYVINEGEEDEESGTIELTDSNSEAIVLAGFHDRCAIKEITVTSSKYSDNDELKAFHFTSDKPVNIIGNIRHTTLSYTFADGTFTHSIPNLFYRMPVINANNLMLDHELDPYCYVHLFDACVELLNTPHFTANYTEEGCYMAMFYECVKIKYFTSDLYATTLSRYCYDSMFKKCSSLLYPATLRATTLGVGCYNEMFSGCTSLQSCPVLPATTMQPECYQRMFNGCTSIKNPPALPSTDLANDCYSYMFAYCSSLSSMPELLAQTLKIRCYDHMFFNCVSLVYTAAFSGHILATDCCAYMFDGCIKLLDTPQLVSTTLANGCYAGMFANCKSLTTAKSLPATNLAVGCYSGMYKGCENLTTAPILNATSSQINCYSQMFSGCKKINYIKCLMLDEPSTQFSTDWLKDVAETGTFVKNVDALWNVRGPNGVPNGWNVVYEGTLDYANEYVVIESLEDGNIIEFGMSDPNEAAQQYAKTIYYSTDRTNWEAASSFGTEVWWRTKMATLNRGDRLLLKGVNATYFTNGYGGDTKIFTSKKFNLYGNAMSLIYGDNFVGQTTFDGTNVYALKAFFRDTLVVDASNLILPATTLAHGCYDSLFLDCEELVIGPSLPATTLAQSCYEKMFMNCTTLTAAPELPVETVPDYCYRYMFYGCTNLETPPELPATLMTAGCYDSMFDGCNKINELHADILTAPGNSYTYDWLANVSETGTFYMNGDAAWDPELNRGPQGVPVGWNIVYYNDYEQHYFTTIARGNGNIQFDIPISTSRLTSMSYSTDNGNTWTTTNNVDGGVNVRIVVPVNEGDKVLWKGDGTSTALDSSIYSNFSSTTNFDVEGNIMSLLNGDNFYHSGFTSGSDNNFMYLFYHNTHIINAENLVLPVTTLKTSCYESMFNGCTALTTIPVLPATTLAGWCYALMFYGCTALTTPPELPATRLSIYCYYMMFKGCTSLTTAPTLSTTTLAMYCYAHMFYGCTSLITAPELPATTLHDWCYNQMFRDCTSLTTAPELPATTLARACYGGMFSDCTSLTSAPELPATTLTQSCYSSMFNGCTSLTSAPELPATTLEWGCYSSMFNGCTNVNNIKMMATDISATQCLMNWVKNVSATGTFTKDANTTIPTGNSGIPSGWTVINE